MAYGYGRRWQKRAAPVAPSKRDYAAPVASTAKFASASKLVYRLEKEATELRSAWTPDDPREALAHAIRVLRAYRRANVAHEALERQFPDEAPYGPINHAKGWIPTIAESVKRWRSKVHEHNAKRWRKKRP